MGKTKINIVGETVEKPKKRTKKTSPEAQVVVAAEKVKPEPINLTIIEAPKKTSSLKSSKHGKNYLWAKAKVDPKKAYSLEEAVRLARDTAITSFPSSVELHLVLEKDKTLNTRVELPYSAGRAKKVEIASDDTIKKLQAGKIDFDVLLASPQMMPKLVPFAKLLGPRGLMPNPKQGTLVDDPQKSADMFGGNHLSLKTEKDAPLVHLVIGKVTQPEKEIEENLKTVITNIGPKTIEKAVLTTTMGPGIRLAVV